ncbi:MAG TPA: MtrB/PioB family outer membrane beta-barrel protein, partial [Steroidobacteraceae bacterium]|nr:MtrB/PioB family outer membrane beta-barrel protein [Steroidobacteraceae bacterium]
MNTNYLRFRNRALRIAVRGALIAVAAATAAHAAEKDADDSAVAALTEAKSTFTVGAGYVSDDSFKFGEFNRLQSKGVYGVGSFDFRGGGKYDSNDASRWRIFGTDLGLDNRSVFAEYDQQGLFKIYVGYDGLRRNRSDSYQTPYSGAGSSTLTLPANWTVPLLPQVSATAVNARGLSSTVAQSSALVNGVLTSPTPAQQATSAAIIAADVPAFHNVNLSTKRNDYSAGLNYLLGHNWEFSASAKHEKKDGLKPMGTVTRTTGGDISTIIPDPIDQKTDQFNASVTYRGKKEFVQFSYYASLFTNNIDSVTWTNWASPATTMTMSSAPSNKFHQFGLTGGYNFSNASKVVVNASYARNTQDDVFLTDTSTPLVPVASLDGQVVTKAFNAQYTAKPIKKLNVTLRYKYDDRDNRTSSNIFSFYD